MKIKGRITKLDERQIVFGWASVAEIEDSQGDVIPLEELEKAAYEYVLNSREGGEMHETIGVAKLIESMVFTPEKLKSLGLKEDATKHGWFVGFKVEDAAAWEKIKSGEYKMFSIGGSARRKKV